MLLTKLGSLPERSSRVIPSTGLGKSLTARVHHSSLIRSNFMALEPLCAVPVHPLPPQPRICPSPGFPPPESQSWRHKGRSLLRLASLTQPHAGPFLRVFPGPESSFVLIAEHRSSVRTDQSLPIGSPPEGQLCCRQVRTEAAVNIYVQVSRGPPFSPLWGKYQGE